MLTHLADVSVRALELALIASLVAWRRSAAVQHAAWTTVACGMLALFAFSSALPRLPLRVLQDLPEQAMPAPVKQFDFPGNLVTQRSAPTPIPPSAPPRRQIDWIELGYMSVTLALLLRFALGTFLAGRLVKNSTLIDGFHESEQITIPVTIGWIRPAILLPPEWREWDRFKLNAVLAHEGAHVRRRDGLIAAIARINRCIFWFHPLAWWLERRLALLAELACDEASVVATGDPKQYASLLLEMTRVVDISAGRLRGHALTMAAGSHIGRRVRALLKEGRRFSKGVTRMGWAAIALGGIPLVWAAGAITLDHQAPPLPSPLQPSNSPKSPLWIAQARQPVPAQPSSPTAAAAQVRFVVASVRPGGPDSFRCLTDKFTMDPDRVEISCVSLQRLMEYAFRLPQKQVDGPAWLHHYGGPRFDISAKLPQGATRDQVPEMLRALLVDRFKLVYHLERREQNVDVLVVAKGGLKLQEVSAPADASTARPDEPAGMQTINGNLMRLNPSTGGRGDSDGYLHTQSRDTIHWDFSSTSLGRLADELAEEFQRPVVDMTGLKGTYHVVLDVKFNPSLYPPPKTLEDLEDQVTDMRNHFNTELQKTGLRLETRKAPIEYVVADRVEHTPTDN
ncbi:MAG TPA: M56 family metallopeptidase [Bryobacteraceae bacterium]